MAKAQSILFQPTRPTAMTPPELALEKEFEAPFLEWQARPTPASAGAMLKAVDPVLQSAMRTFGAHGAASPTLRASAKRIVLDSLPRYDPQKSKLRTYLMANLQSLRRAAAEEEQVIGVPERVRLDQLHLHRGSADLADTLGRDPSTAELARHTGLTLKRIEHVRKASPSLAEGQLASRVDSEGQPSDSAAAVVPKNQDAYLNFVYGDLAPTDQFIMEHTLGLFGKPPLQKREIAAKLGISQGAVSQRAAKIQRILDQHERVGATLF